MASSSFTIVAIMLFGAAYAPHASANGPHGYANTNDWFQSLGLPTPPPLFLPNGQPFPQQEFFPQQPIGGNGMTMSSSSSSNGKGGTTITVTQNGETQTFTVGDNPPPSFQPRTPTKPKKPTAPKMLNLNFPKFEPIPMPKMIDPEEIKSYKPSGNGDNFVGMSSSSFSSTSNVNGKKTSIGGMKTVSNINGVVSEKSIILNGDGVVEEENEV